MMNNNEILEGKFPLAYIKSLPAQQLADVAQRMRSAMVESLLESGGHFSSNLGTIELTLALHYVFNSPRDKFLFDVGHQCYAHKIITGRGEAFASIRQFGGLSGFTRPQESEHDILSSGHASVSLSVAAGMVAGQALEMRKQERVLAIIGDAGLSGGIAFEALNHIGAMGLPVIVILNDNQMSIAPGCGALHEHLAILEDRNFFTTLGFEYWGDYDGHDCALMVDLFTKAKAVQRPLLIHLKTQKGKGYPAAEIDPIAYHGITGKGQAKASAPSYTQIFSEALVGLAQKHEDVVAITAAMPSGTGVDKLEKLMPQRCYDVGIAEQHAVAFASGLALAGKRVVVALYATFLQRAVDQVIHDVVMQRLPMIITLDRAGVVAGDGESHQGVYDIALLQSLPNLIFLAPASGEELKLMLSWASEQSTLVVIRYAKAEIPDAQLKIPLEPLVLGVGVFWHRVEDAAILLVSLGSLAIEVERAIEYLGERNIAVDHCHARFIKPLNVEYWQSLLAKYSLVVTLEEAVVDGGWGVQLASLMSMAQERPRFLHLGVESSLLPHGSRDDLLRFCQLDGTSIAQRVASYYQYLDDKSSADVV
ncbi:1-deoxy-D-xylulose-5-phosphate synthase [Entomospira culicis]|uniref:1-deoxy-D-xylulose-5-phosphate synthase n=2 Tax=Entomospira culicis TaxID=2719989 RepID=A0A968KUH0_9SPIO|nr:1-deoxy-D-xylulose-5-phosphate synthase [Entomospira culicis]NIZ19536.1 1-deoxy-D-xylulose-5-phosphate synthase [Entomospira culicis]NIZ69559.1 1-deoxy-D-xylulose-5-phosphate synthase [Entomospira culicis]WDI36670.1 1-deoxy-D-xylulose-5-phosphate synthase [Entomospira culicis]WDI38299.1 1-deoxy-D-xylulose-5-phosphate synthase [Entomospira culicis]